MAEYRLYCLDKDGKDVDAHFITAANDEDAIGQAKALEGLRQCEVWRVNRLIATVTRFDESPE